MCPNASRYNQLICDLFFLCETSCIDPRIGTGLISPYLEGSTSVKIKQIKCKLHNPCTAVLEPRVYFSLSSPLECYSFPCSLNHSQSQAKWSKDCAHATKSDSDTDSMSNLPNWMVEFTRIMKMTFAYFKAESDRIKRLRFFKRKHPTVYATAITIF